MREAFEIITSRQNALLVEVHKLADRKHRARLEQFRFDGVKLAAEALAKGVELRAVLLRRTDAEHVLERVADLSGREFDEKTRVVCVEDDVFDRLSQENAPEGIICVAHAQRQLHGAWTSRDIPVEQRVMLLESVRDPSNLGAIVRSAAALGVDRLVLSADCADIYHPKTLRASMGTVFSEQIDIADDLIEVIRALQASGRRVLAAALEPDSSRLGEMELHPGDCAVVGNEGHGLCPETLAACGQSVYIPMTDHAESLNAAVAASLLMWELFGKGRI